MTPEELAMLSDTERAGWEACQRATPGPWVARVDGWTIRAFPNGQAESFKIACTYPPVIEGLVGKTPAVEHQVANQEFIAIARTELPAVYETIARLRARLRELYELDRRESPHEWNGPYLHPTRVKVLEELESV